MSFLELERWLTKYRHGCDVLICKSVACIVAVSGFVRAQPWTFGLRNSGISPHLSLLTMIENTLL